MKQETEKNSVVENHLPQSETLINIEQFELQEAITPFETPQDFSINIKAETELEENNVSNVIETMNALMTL